MATWRTSRASTGRDEAIMIALMRMEDKLEEILRILLGEDDGEEELDA
jgi:hypothetical protein